MTATPAVVPATGACPRCGPWARPSSAWGTADGAASRRPALPWRSTRDPWAVLVSEVMAQQTQLARVVPAYPRFLAALPDPGGLRGACTGRRAPSLAGPGLQPPGPRPAPGGRGHRGRARGPGPRRSPRSAGPARRGCLHGAGGDGLCLRGRRRGGRHQRRAGPLPGGGRTTVAGQARPSSWWTPWSRPGRGGRSARPCSTWAPPSAWPATRAVAGARSGRGAGGRPRGSASPDPAARLGRRVHPPAPFDGSDRQGRGRLVDALRHGPLSARQVIGSPGGPDDPDRVDRHGGRAGRGRSGRPGPHGTLRLP